MYSVLIVMLTISVIAVCFGGFPGGAEYDPSY